MLSRRFEDKNEEIFKQWSATHAEYEAYEQVNHGIQPQHLQGSGLCIMIACIKTWTGHRHGPLLLRDPDRVPVPQGHEDDGSGLPLPGNPTNIGKS